MVFRALIVVLLLNAVLVSSQLTQKEKDIDANSVYVQFGKNEGELLEIDEWWRNSTSIFKDVTAEEASYYCRNATEACNLVDLTSDFGSGDVMLDGEPEAWNGDIRLKVYISLTGKNIHNETLPPLIPKENLTEILIMGEDSYNSRLSEGRDFNITLMFVDDQRVPPPADFTTNTIMIIVSLLILLAAVLLAVVLKCKEKMEEKKMLEGVGGHTTVANDDGENLTLTAIKTKGEDDSPGEGNNGRRSRVGPNICTNNNVRTQETQTSARVVFIHDPNAIPNDPRGSIPSLRGPSAPHPSPAHQSERSITVGEGSYDASAPMWDSDGTHILKKSVNADGGMPEYGSIGPKTEDGVTGVTNPFGSPFVRGEGDTDGGVLDRDPLSGATTVEVHEMGLLGNKGGTPSPGKKASRHSILPPLGEGEVQDLTGDISGDLVGPAQEGMDGSESDSSVDKKLRKKRRAKGRKRKDDKNGLLTRSLSPLNEERVPGD